MTLKSPDNAAAAGELRTAVFPGSFNPFTIGHLSILRRALKLFDRVVVLVGFNESKGGFDQAGRLADELSGKLSRLEGFERASVMAWGGLTVDAARKLGACCMVRGVRSTIDYEYERNLADINRELSDIDTVLLTAEPSVGMISSSMVRELNHFGHDTSKYTL